MKIKAEVDGQCKCDLRAKGLLERRCMLIHRPHVEDRKYAVEEECPWGYYSRR